MARIAGINIPQNKLVHIGLTYIYGIGDKFSKKICSSLEIPKEKRVNQLTDEEILKIREFIDQNFEIFRFFKILLLPTMKSITFCAILFLRLINHCECKPVQNIAIKTENGYENSLFAQLMIKQFDYGSDLSIGN